MPSRDHPRTLTSWHLGAWLGELASVSAGLVEAYVPGSPGVTARTREQLIIAVAEVDGCRTTAWVHGAWLDFLGSREPDEALTPLFDYARSCAVAGVPLDTTTLDAVYPEPVVRSVRATVARAELADLFTSTLDVVRDRVAGRRPRSLGALVSESFAIVVAAPFALPTATLAGAMKLVTRAAPALPAIELPAAEDANLVAHLLAEAAPSYLGHVFVRSGLVWSPLRLSIAFRMEGTAATISVGRGHVHIENGVRRDALLVVDGGIEPLLRTVAGSILRDLGVPVKRVR